MQVGFLAPDPLDRDTRTAREIGSLAEAGHQLLVVAPAGGDEAVRANGRVTVAAAGLRRRRWPLKPVVSLLNWPALLIALWRTNPEVVHAYGRRALLRGWMVAKLRRRLLVYDAVACPGRPQRGAWRERRLLRRCRAVVADSTAAARRIREQERVPVHPVIVRDVPDIVPGEIPAADLRARLGLGEVRLVLYDARHQERHFDQLLVALAELRDAHLIVLCDPPAADRLRLSSERHRVAGRVHVIRGVAPRRLCSYAHEADVAVCFPDHDLVADHEPPPPQLLRYVAAGRRVIASPAACVDVSLDTVLPVEPSDPAALSSALRDALAAGPPPSDPSGCWSSEALKLESVYATLAQSPDAPLATPSSLATQLRRARREALTLASAGRSHPSAAINYAKARQLRASGRLREAEQCLATAVELDPGNARYWFHWGAALRDTGEKSGAIAAFHKVLAVQESWTGSVAASAAVALARLGVRDEPLQVVAALERTEHTTPDQWVRIAEVYTALSRVDLALEALSRIPLGEVELSAQRGRMRVLEQCGELSAALDCARILGDEPAEARLLGSLRTFSPEWLPEPPKTDGWRGPDSDRVVLHLLETALPYATSGYTYRTNTVLASQRRAGLQPVAVTRLGFPATRGEYTHSALEMVDEVLHHFLTLPGVTHYTSIPADERMRHNVDLVARIVEEVRPAALHATSPHFNGLLGLSLREAFGVPLVYEARGFPEMTWAVRAGGADAQHYGLRRAAETRCMLEADAVVTLSHVMRDQIVARGVPEEQVFVVPHMVDTDRFSPRPKDAGLLDRYGIGEDEVVAGYVSSLVDYEGVDTLLRGIAEARREDPRIVGLIVGDGLAMPVLRALASELGLGDAVVFTGRVPHAETIEHYALIDIFVVPRRRLEVCAYVTPLKPFEAMAMERCLVVSDLPALWETVGHGDHGRRFVPDDAAGLAGSLVELAEDPELRIELGRRGRAFVEAHHSRALAREVTAAPIDYVCGLVGARREALSASI